MVAWGLPRSVIAVFAAIGVVGARVAVPVRSQAD
jgi:hypothetical protein